MVGLEMTGPVKQFPFWILRELIGIAVLLAAIVYLPVWVSGYFSIKEIPFQRQFVPRKAIRVFAARGEVRAALVAVVEGQLDALRQRDFDAAWEWASFDFRRQVPVSDFERMVSSGFQIMMEPHEREFGGVYNNFDMAFVDVKLVGTTSGTACFTYVLESKGGRWFVAGVEGMDLAQFDQRRPNPRGSKPGGASEGTGKG